MDDGKPKLVPFEGGAGSSQKRMVGGVEIPPPPPNSHLTTGGRRLYDWICEALIKDGRKISAAGIQIVMLVHTMTTWSADMKLCLEAGRYGESKDGNRYELPHSYNERNARAEIKRELPEACLTVMSQIEARLKESKVVGGVQDDLFADLVDHAKDRPRAFG